MSGSHSLTGFMAFSTGSIIVGILAVAVYTADDPSEALRMPVADMNYSATPANAPLVSDSTHSNGSPNAAADKAEPVVTELSSKAEADAPQPVAAETTPEEPVMVSQTAQPNSASSAPATPTPYAAHNTQAQGFSGSNATLQPRMNLQYYQAPAAQYYAYPPASYFYSMPQPAPWWSMPQPYPYR